MTEMKATLIGSTAVLLWGALALFTTWTGKIARNGFSRRNHLFVALQGILLFCLNYWVFYIATNYLTSGLVAVLFSLILVMNIINQAIFFQIRVQMQVVVAALFGLLGIGLVFRPEISSLDMGDSSMIGLGLCLLATYIASLGNMVVIRNSRAKLPVIETNAFGMAYGAGFSFLIVLLAGVPITFDTSFDYIWSLAYLSLFGSVLASCCYLTLLGRIGADRASYAAILFPAVALTLSTFFEDYQWTTDAIIGIILILGGNVLALTKPAYLAILVGRRAKTFS